MLGPILVFCLLVYLSWLTSDILDAMNKYDPGPSELEQLRKAREARRKFNKEIKDILDLEEK